SNVAPHLPLLPRWHTSFSTNLIGIPISGGSRMRSFNLVRSLCCTGLALGLLAGAAITSAQDVTTEPTEDMMMTQMMSMQGACPQGEASMMLTSMMGVSSQSSAAGATQESSTTGTTGTTSSSGSSSLSATQETSTTG